MRRLALAGSSLAVLILLATPVLADGGDGSSGTGGRGSDGTPTNSNGASGGSGSSYYSGGSGGADGASFSTNQTISADITGSTGADGAYAASNSPLGGSGGGGGGAGIVSDGADLVIDSGVTVSGGSGGDGAGGGITDSHGGGGGGGAGIGASGAQITNNGIIQGGNGGGGGANGAGGAGIVGSDIDVTNNGTISGGSGAGTSNSITFSGGTNSLTLQTGSTLTGDIVASGSLTLDQSANYTLPSDISGSAALTKSGTGTLTLTGDFDHSGGTTLSDGTLQIGDGGTTGAIDDDITNNAALTFNRSDDITYADVISGTGSLTKSGSGKLTLSGTNTYTGTTTVSAGTLAINGSIVSALTLQNGATLGGTGTTDDITVQSGGIHAPGNSIGTQTINGNYVLNSGSILAIEVDDAGNADKVIVNGTVDISGATLRLNSVSDNNFSGDDSYSYVIIENDGTDAVTGTFASIDNKLAFYEATSSTTGGTGNDVSLTLSRNANSFTDIASTGNQNAVASQITNLSGSDGETIRNAILGLANTEAKRAYEQLSGDVHSSSTAVNGQIAQQASGQIGGRLAALNSNSSEPLVSASTLSPATLAGFAPAGPAASDNIATDGDVPLLALGNNAPLQTGSAIWLQMIGGTGRIDGDDNIDATDYKWTGMIGGYDTRLSEVTTIGLYFGYADGNSRQSKRDATLDAGNYMAGLYGDHDLGDDWRLSGQAGWTRIKTDSRRNLDFGAIDRTATADYTDQAISADMEIAKGFDVARNWRVEPYAGLGMLWNDYASFTETGAGSANLSRSANSKLTGTASLGLRVASMFETGNGQTVIPQFRLGWDRHIGPVSTSTTLAFGSTSSFTVSGSDTDRDTLTGNLGVVLSDQSGWSLYGDYQPTISQTRTEHAFAAGFRIRF
jgi:outer membrane autotransporter protein